ncbi:hypothetical protein [Deinococcus ruber]|uniref:Uncharacterized protein n=1 Tax=Deinococcus ruber TaxID=1848197 RepID=A0A918FES1_9DEIO|nr:hypothetical protein [Deinococcus ruber]GGR31294.1 hypothetical protein GCM10008957_47460 [Deinococcus ruber]
MPKNADISASHKAALDELLALTTDLSHAAVLVKPALQASADRVAFLLGTLDMHAELKFRWPTGKTSR